MKYFWPSLLGSWKTETATAFDRAMLGVVGIGFVSLVWFFAGTKFWLPVPSISSLEGDGIAWVQGIMGLALLIAVAIGFATWRQLSDAKRTTVIQMAGLGLLSLQGLARIGVRPEAFGSFMRLGVSWALIGAGLTLFIVALAYRHFTRIPPPGGLEG